MKTWILLVVSLLLLTTLATAAGTLERVQDGYVIHGNERALEEVEKAYAEIPPVAYSPSADRWTHLDTTKKLLRKGPVLRVVMLGDSIVNDTSRSGWDLVLQKQNPMCRIEKVTSVRGSTGCWWYRENDRVKPFVLDHQPDLVIIGGISQRDDVESIQEVIRQIRAVRAETEVLLMTSAFGAVDPRNDRQWQEKVPKEKDDYRVRLRQLAQETDSAFLDMTAAWGRYVRDSGKELDFFKRDAIHANARGEQVLGRILVRFLAVDAPQ